MPDGDREALARPRPPRPLERATAVVVVGLSAGGLSALRTLVERLPADTTAAIIIAHHIGTESVLPQLIGFWSGRDACFATEGCTLYAGRIYVCPPGYHVVVRPTGALGVARRGRLAFIRPSIDWLFETAAASFGARAIAVLLSGGNSDGALGARFIAEAGGTVIVQAPATCKHPQMPLHALAASTVHATLPPAELAPAITRELARIAADHPAAWPEPFGDEVA
jgi:two-component system chemotaxis response regulator CheB